MPTLSPIADRAEALTAFFRDLHAHPELGFQETRTAARVAEALTSALAAEAGHAEPLSSARSAF